MKKFILLFSLFFFISSCKESECYLHLYFYINNQTSYDLELFKDYKYSATIKKDESFLWLQFEEEKDNIVIQYSLINDLIKKKQCLCVSLENKG